MIPVLTLALVILSRPVLRYFRGRARVQRRLREISDVPRRGAISDIVSNGAAI